MMMNLNEFATEVHALAVEKGFYDPAPSDAELIAAIHSEISEAFEEWRAGRPMVHYDCGYSTENDPQPCIRMECPNWNDEDRWCYDCGTLPPEGIAMELIDVVLRVLDFIVGHGFEVVENDVDSFARDGCMVGADKLSMSRLVLSLHYGATVSFIHMEQGAGDSEECFNAILGAVFSWLRAQNIDPEAIMLEKHNYNKTRPYKHGGKRI